MVRCRHPDRGYHGRRDHVVKGTEQGAGFNVGDTISFFPKMTRNNKAMAGGPV